MATDTIFPESLRKFAALPIEQRQSVTQMLANAPPAVSIEALAEGVSAKTQTDRGLLVGIFDGLARIVPIVAGEPDMRVDLARTLARVATDNDDPDAADGEIVKQFDALLRCDVSLGLTGKAQNILWGHGEVYRDAHVVTQIRPLFFDNLDAPATHAVVVHDLRIDVQQSGLNSSRVVTIDAAKIRHLVKILQRAIKKEDAIRRGKCFNYVSEKMTVENADS